MGIFLFNFDSNEGRGGGLSHFIGNLFGTIEFDITYVSRVYGRFIRESCAVSLELVQNRISYGIEPHILNCH